MLKNVILEIRQARISKFLGCIMNCKNCGAKLKPQDRQCPNCGAAVRGENGYVLTSSKDEKYYYGDDEPVKKKSGIKRLLAIILIGAIIIGGEYYYFNVYKKKTVQPQVNFTYGAGVINDDEQVVYVAIDESAQIQYINGVTLYGYDKTQSSNDKPLSTDYEYTKTESGIFRSIFFDLADFDIEPGKDYTYTFEMIFSFYEDNNQYTYTQVVNFNSSTENDVSDIIFDHSGADYSAGAEDTAQSTVPTTATSTTAAAAAQNTGDSSFLYSGFWYTEPYHDADNYSIDAIQFAKNGGCTVTSYSKSGNGAWTSRQTNTTFSVKNGVLTVKNDGDYVIDFNKKSVAGLTQRKYNSVKNAEDFFGL